MEIVLLVIGTCVVLLGAIYLWTSLFTSEHGERYRRQSMQGPFVPVHPDADQEPPEVPKK